MPIKMLIIPNCPLYSPFHFPSITSTPSTPLRQRRQPCQPTANDKKNDNYSNDNAALRAQEGKAPRDL